MLNYKFVTPLKFLSVLLFLLPYACSIEADKNTATSMAKSSLEDSILNVNSGVSEDNKKKLPNILLIVADDLGYSDLAVFGGEIETPNLDSLANGGILLTSFYTAPTCSPTRSMLLSGTDNHLAGLGRMSEGMSPEYEGRLGYEGYLNFRVAALPELLQDAGYHTYMAGKWHLGLEEFNSPSSRGFEKSYALLNGYSGHFNDNTGGAWAKTDASTYREDGNLVTLPEDFYSTKFYTEKLIQYIDENSGDGNPFFGYLAYTAPHWPLQAMPDTIAKYKGKYDEGYDVLKSRRITRLKKLGLIDDGVKPAERKQGQPAWDELSAEQKKFESRKMEIYAAMVHDLDYYVGQLVTYLKKINEFENTLIFFMSDNGADGNDVALYDGALQKIDKCCDNSYDNMGKANSFLWYSANWAQAATAPFRLHKGFVYEGGIRAPALVHYPGLEQSGNISDQFVTVMDVMPTILEFAEIKFPGSTFRERQILPMRGESMLPLLKREAIVVHGDDYVVGWEYRDRAIRQGNWKIVWGREPHGTGDWQLYDVKVDPAELNDLSLENPTKLREMIQLWEIYVQENGVILLN